MNENQTLEMQIKASSDEALKSLNKLINGLTGIEKQVNKISKSLNSVSTNNATKEMNKLNSAIDKTSKTMQKFKQLFTFAGTKRLGTTMLNWLNSGMDFSEQLNLFNVVFDNIEKDGKQTFSTLGKEATKFQYKMNEAFGTNKTQTLYTQGIYQAMAETVKIPEYYASIMSENTTKLTYDLASLFNKQETDTAEALRAGVFAGQTKPLRAYGIDVTQQSLQPILESLGIDDRTVKQLSQAEKEILRYIATLRQAQNAMGDMANTIESPSNQIKVFRQQLNETKVAVSSLFIGSFQKILPYANAFLMVVKEISKAIADMFGIKISDYNSGIASAGDAYADLGDDIDDAIGKVKELKRQTLGFDEIHNLTENNDSGSGVSDITGGIDQRLLDAITGYDNGMNKVRMKATEIRDRIMEWLGFTKEIDPLTGEVGFKLKDGETRFKSILNFLKTIKDVLFFALDHAQEIITIIISYKITKGLENILTTLTKISGINLTKLTTSLGKIGLIAGGTLTLAEGVSKTDFYTDYVKSILGDDYDGPTDLYGMVGEIISQTNELNNDNKNNGEMYMYNLQRDYANLQYGKMQGLDAKTIEKLQQEYEKSLNEYKRLVSNQSMGLSNLGLGLYNFGGTGWNFSLEDSLKKYLEESEDNLMLLFHGYKLFNNNGDNNITNYTNSFTEYLTELSKTYDITSSYAQKMRESQQDFDNATESLTNTLTLLQTPGYNASVNDIEQVTNAIKNLASASTVSYNAMYDGVIKIVAKYHEQGLASDEETERIITNLEKQKLAQEGKSREFIEKYQELENQVKNNIITQEQFTKGVIDLYEQYGEGNTTLTNVTKKWETYGDMLMITASSYDELSNSFTNAQTEYSNTAKELEIQTNNTKNMLAEYAADMKEKYGETSQEYQDAIGLMVKADENKEKSMSELNDNYAKYLSSMLRSLVNSGQLETEEGKKLAKNLNTELGKIGYGVDLNSSISNINKQLDRIGDNISVTIPIGMDTSSANWSLNNFVDNAIWKVNNIKDTLVSILKGKANGGIYSNGSWQDIPQYAYGGIPSHGSLVFAGENGPEIMGNVNGRTEILNKSQIASAIYSAVVSAMSQFGGQSSEIDLHLHTDEGIVIDRINQKTKQTGVCPINIPSY